jgi:hypothetical protein
VRSASALSRGRAPLGLDAADMGIIIIAAIIGQTSMRGSTG